MADEHKRFAVVIGVSAYDDDIVELPFAKNDACRLQSLLQKCSGFDGERVYLLTNGLDSATDVKVTPPTKPNILQKLQYVCHAAGPEDLILLYFAGHGAEISRTPYLITSDTKMDVLSKTALNVDELNGMLESAGSRCVLRVFDACRSPFAEGRGTLGRMTEGLQKAVMKCGSGWATFSSCSSGEMARESSEFNQGVFTYYLCEGLSGKARNHQGEITIEGLVEYVKTSVGNWCDRQTLPQTPHFQSDLSGAVVLGTSLAGPAVHAMPLDSPFAELVAGIELHLSSTAEDVRRLTFTSEKERHMIAEAVHQQLGRKLAQFSHPAMTATLGEMLSLREHGNPSWTAFHTDVASSGLQNELATDAVACKVEFKSTEVVVPASTLYVAVVTFNFFYWLWYCHVCHPQQLQGRFKPDPPYARGFFTFKPSGARDKDKTDQTLSEMLLRSSREMLMWAKQLGEYVESRVDPVRKAGPIID